MNHARTALTNTAAKLSPGQTKMLTQNAQQRFVAPVSATRCSTSFILTFMTVLLTRLPHACETVRIVYTATPPSINEFHVFVWVSSLPDSANCEWAATTYHRISEFCSAQIAPQIASFSPWIKHAS